MKRITDTIVFIEGPFFEFPYCHCVLVEDDCRCLLDTAMSPGRFSEIIDGGRLDMILYTHGHLDHVYNRTRTDRPFYLHESEQVWMDTEESFLQAFGFVSEEEKVFGRQMMLVGEWAAAKPSGLLIPGDLVELGKNRIEVLHLPGHTPGHCGFFFIDEGILFSGDLDLTGFGPFYGNTVSSIDEFIASIEFLIELQPDMIIPGHGDGLVKKHIRQRLRDYRDVIFQREENLLAELRRRGKATLADVAHWKVIYGQYRYPQMYEPLYRVLERNMDAKHLDRLVAQGKVIRDGEYYAAV